MRQVAWLPQRRRSQRLAPHPLADRPRLRQQRLVGIGLPPQSEQPFDGGTCLGEPSQALVTLARALIAGTTSHEGKTVPAVVRADARGARLWLKALPDRGFATHEVASVAALPDHGASFE